MKGLLTAYRGLLRSYYGQIKEEKERPFLLYRYLYRPLSFPLSALAIRVGASANTLTALNLFLLVGALAATALGTPASMVIGAWVYFVYFVLDFADGNVARYFGASSYFGKLVDGMVDTVSFLMFATVAWGNVRSGASWIDADAELFLGIAASFSALLRQNYQWRMAALKAEIRLSQSPPGTVSASLPMRPIAWLFGNLASSAPVFLLVAVYANAVTSYVLAFFLLYGIAGILEIIIGVLKNRAALRTHREY